MKKLLMGSVLSLLVLSMVPVSVYAGHGKECHKKECSKCSGCEKCSYGKEQGGLKEKFYHKAHFMLQNAEAIGLSEDQVMSIKQQKIDLEKMLIARHAEIEIAALDIKAAMHAYPVDEAKLLSLVEQKYAIKEAKAKDLVKAYAKLRNGLSEAQNAKMKEVWKTGSSSH